MACPLCFSKMQVVSGITESNVVERILRHLGLFDLPRAPTPHDCPSPPAMPDGQTLMIFAPRPIRPVEPPPEPEEIDPRLNDDWPVDPPFEDD